MRERKQHIIERYSKENHVGYLLANSFSFIQKNSKVINKNVNLYNNILLFYDFIIIYNNININFFL